jgi:hypothetical protein
MDIFVITDLSIFGQKSHFSQDSLVRLAGDALKNALKAT